MRYRLATYRECKAHREWNTTCPDCGRRGKFSPYIDTATMRPVDDRTCGRCNRLSNCGYHLPPREMPRNEDFGARRSREKRESPGPVNYASHRSHESHRSCIAEGSQLPSGVYTRRSRQQGRSDLPFREISEICVRQKEEFGETKNSQREANEFYEKMRRACDQSQPWGSHLVTWLRTQFPREQVAAALKRYRVGGTPDGATLWWQIDTQGRVHTGKAMQYNPLTGHRVKEQGFPVNWAHRMRLYGEPSDLVVPQCLFGLRLLNTEHTALTTDYTDFSDSLQDGRSTPQEGNPCNPRNPLSLTTDYTDFSDSLQDGRSTPHEGNPCNLRNLWSNSPWSEKIGLVESEKTALVMSLVCPDHVWLATGGKANLKDSMLAPLIGLEVAVYPDADALRDWYARIVEMNRTLGTRLHIPTWYYNLMDHPEAIARGLDLADILMGGGYL